MKDMGIRTGSPAMAVPVIIGTDTVYEHLDIKEITNDDGSVVYEYHEIQYTHEEWMQILGERNQALEEELANTQSELSDTQIALVEVYELIGG